jgi:hypothetical protein
MSEYAVCKGGIVKNAQGQAGQQVICVRKNEQEAQGIANQLEKTARYLAFLEFSSHELETGGAEQLVQHNTPENYQQFVDKFKLDNPQTGRLYSVRKK